MGDLVCDVLGGGVGGGASRPSSHERRTAAHRLPQAFFLYTRHNRYVLGVAVFVSVFRVQDARESVTWVATRGVRLLEPFAVGLTMVKFHGNIFLLKPSVESQIRNSEAAVGGTLGAHMVEFGDNPIRCFTVEQAHAQGLLRDDPTAVVRITTSPTFLLSAGVTATDVDALPSVNGNDEEDIEDDLVGGEETSHPPAPMPVMQPSSIADIEVRMRGFYTQVSGAVDHRYTAEGMLEYLNLSSMLKANTDMTNVLSASVSLLLGPAGKELSDKMRSKSIALPSVSILRLARMKLDVLSLRYQQKVFSSKRVACLSIVGLVPPAGI